MTHEIETPMASDDNNIIAPDDNIIILDENDAIDEYDDVFVWLTYQPAYRPLCQNCED